MNSTHFPSRRSHHWTPGRLTWFGLFRLTLVCAYFTNASGAPFNLFVIKYSTKTEPVQTFQKFPHHALHNARRTSRSQETLPWHKTTESAHKSKVPDSIPNEYFPHPQVIPHSFKRADSGEMQTVHLAFAPLLGATDNRVHGPDIPKLGRQVIHQDANIPLFLTGIVPSQRRRFLFTDSSQSGLSGSTNALQDSIWQRVLESGWRVNADKLPDVNRKKRNQPIVLKNSKTQLRPRTSDVYKVNKNNQYLLNKNRIQPEPDFLKLVRVNERVKREAFDFNDTIETSSFFTNESIETSSHLNKTPAIAPSINFEPNSMNTGNSSSIKMPLTKAGVSDVKVLITADEKNNSFTSDDNVKPNEKQQLAYHKDAIYNNTILFRPKLNSLAVSNDTENKERFFPSASTISANDPTFTDFMSKELGPRNTDTNSFAGTTISARIISSKSTIVSSLIKITEAQPHNSTSDIIFTSFNTSAPTFVTENLSNKTEKNTLSSETSTVSTTWSFAGKNATKVVEGNYGNDSLVEGEQIGKAKAEPEPEPEPKKESKGKLDGEPKDKSNDESKSEPEGELTGESTTEPTEEPSGEPIGEPEGEPKSEDSDSPFPLPEPGPKWDEAKQKWGIAWDVHVYGLGGAFGVVGIYTFLSLIRLWRIPRLLSKGYFFSLNFLMMALCGTRAGYLLYDSYNSRGTLPISLDYFLYSFAFPCLSAAFSVLLYALLKATNMQLVSPSVQRLPVLVFIIMTHFGLSLASDLLVGRFAGARIVLFVCQMYYILWGLFLFAGYAYIFRRLYSHAMKRQKNVIYASTSSSTFPGGSNGSLTSGKIRNRYTLSTAVKITFFTALCGLVTVGLELYAVAGVYNTFTWDRPEPWPWYMYHTVLRVLELAMCVTMSYVASQPFRYRKSESSCCSCCVFCVPCGEILCCSRRYNVTDPRQHVNSAGSCSYSDLDLAPTKLHSTRLRTPGDREQLQGFSSPVGGRKRTFISAPGPPQPSLLVVEDGYVRFQTDKDIKRRVDSPMIGGRAKVAHDFHNANTLPLRDGSFNSDYPCQTDENRVSGDAFDQTDNVTGFAWDDDKSRKSSLAGCEFYRPLSSVSLADSIENELEKAFVTFRMDVTHEKLQAAELEKAVSDEHILDITAVSELPYMKETDLVSVDSLPHQDFNVQQITSSSPKLPQTNSSEPNHPSTSLRPEPSLTHLTPISPRRPFTLLRRAKSSEVDSTYIDSHQWTQMLKRSLSDHMARRQPLKSESSSVRYSHLLDMDSTDSKLSEPRHLGLNDVFTRRGSPESGTIDNQDAFTKSLLNSPTANDNDIDV